MVPGGVSDPAGDVAPYVLVCPPPGPHGPGPWTECLQESSLGLPFEAEGRGGCRGTPESQAPPVLALGHQCGLEGFLVQPGIFEMLRPSVCKCLWRPGLS